MAQDEDFFDLSLEEDVDSFDPLAEDGHEVEPEDAPAESGVVTADPREFPTNEQLAKDAEAQAQLPPEQRIATLFDHMQPYRQLLLDILRKAQQPVPNAEMKDAIAEWQQDDAGVYSPDNLCMMLVRAGALRRVTPDGEDYEELERTAEPEHVVVDGVEYLKPAVLPQICWLATPEGNAAVAGDVPEDRMRNLLESEPQYAHIYRIVLDEAGHDEGTSEKTLSKLIDHDPAVQKPRMYAMRFAGKLADAEAIVWRDGAWHITEVGKDAYDVLDRMQRQDA
jgi:hypothetical protein